VIECRKIITERINPRLPVIANHHRPPDESRDQRRNGGGKGSNERDHRGRSSGTRRRNEKARRLSGHNNHPGHFRDTNRFPTYYIIEVIGAP
jgi:hypothetical protein